MKNNCYIMPNSWKVAHKIFINRYTFNIPVHAFKYAVIEEFCTRYKMQVLEWCYSVNE